MTNFTTPRTWSVGELVTAAMMNEQIRDNQSAIWVGAAAADLDYYTSDVAKARLAKGPAYGLLRMNSADDAPEWSALLNYAVAGRGTTMNITSDTSILWSTDIDDPHGWHNTSTNTNRITPGAAGVYVAWAMVHATAADLMRVTIKKNNASVVGAMRGGNVGTYEGWVNAISYPVTLGATDYFNVIADCNGATGVMQTDSFFAALRIR